MVTKYQNPFPLPPSIIRERTYSQKLLKMPISIMKSVSEEVANCLQMILEAKHCNYRAIQYRESDRVYVGGTKYNRQN